MTAQRCTAGRPANYWRTSTVVVLSICSLLVYSSEKVLFFLAGMRRLYASSASLISVYEFTVRRLETTFTGTTCDVNTPANKPADSPTPRCRRFVRSSMWTRGASFFGPRRRRWSASPRSRPWLWSGVKELHPWEFRPYSQVGKANLVR